MLIKPQASTKIHTLSVNYSCSERRGKIASFAKNHTVADIAAIYISDLTLHNISQRRPINNKQLDLVLKKILWTHLQTDINQHTLVVKAGVTVCHE
ncbi:hypothetical protein J6590_090927, partial [Homalodisca vitripennis]